MLGLRLPSVLPRRGGSGWVTHGIAPSRKSFTAPVRSLPVDAVGVVRAPVVAVAVLGWTGGSKVWF